MTNTQFAAARKLLEKTQKELSFLLATSLKAVHSYEQGWRKIPPHVERQLYFLLSKKPGALKNTKACWTMLKCPPEKKTACPAWEFKAGKICWFINGTICNGTSTRSWEEKMKRCRRCKVLKQITSQLGR